MMLRKYKQANLANFYIVPINKIKQLLNNLEGKKVTIFLKKTTEIFADCAQNAYLSGGLRSKAEQHKHKPTCLGAPSVE